ncbi:MAG: hypothetical protein LDL33_00660 [Desulfomonile sp.]|nr:hypothetical protein [Desulfomonile sp.]
MIGVVLCAAIALIASYACATDAGYTQYRDPLGRFAFDYPSTMEVRSTNPDQVSIFHPSASLRISVFVEKRARRGEAKAGPFLASFKERLKLDMKDAVVLDESEAQKGSDSGHLVCAFKDRRGLEHVQLVHYVVGEDKVLQMIISDRPSGFANLEPVIRKVHGSLQILGRGLK